MRAKHIVGFIDRNFVLRFAAETILNTYTLRDVASKLLAAEHYGVARSITISAREELGKFYLCGLYLTGAITGKELGGYIFGHKDKQMYGQLLSSLAPTVSNLLKRNNSRLEQTVDDPHSTVKEVIAVLHGTEREQLESCMTRPVDEIRSELSAIRDDGTMEDKRQRGLYVSPDLKPPSNGVIAIHAPRNISKEEAQSEMDGLNRFFDLVEHSSQSLSAATIESSISFTNRLNSIQDVIDQVFRPEFL